MGPGEEPSRGEYYWHEVVGTAVHGIDGTDLGRVEDVYRVGGAEVFVVRGGPFGEFDLPVVRAFIRIFAPRRGEIVIDADALALEPPRPPRPRGRRTRRGETGAAATAPDDPSAAGRNGRRGPAGGRPGRAVTLEIDLLTLFPGMVEGPLSDSIPARIQEQGLATVRVHDLRRWGVGRHRSVDDYTYGGGAGMVLRPEPVAAALDELRRPESTVILPDPAGDRFSQAAARSLSAETHLIFVCPRYEGFDERIRSMVDLEISIGDYVLSGGELPALVVIDAVLRLLPGAIDAESVEIESFADGLLEYPQYTRPADVSRHGRSTDPGERRPRRGAPVAAARIPRPDAAPAPGPADRPAPVSGGAFPARGDRGGGLAAGGPARPVGGEAKEAVRDGLRAVLYSAVGRPVGPPGPRITFVQPRNRARAASVAQHR